MSEMIVSGPELLPLSIKKGLSMARRKDAFSKQIHEFGTHVIFGVVDIESIIGYSTYYWLTYRVYVHTSVEAAFRQKFRYWINTDEDNRIHYDNLVNVCIMVKDGGYFWETFLRHNKPLMDSYTILDTGSTDGTVEIARRVLADVKGEIYTSEFTNFRDSRNQLLDLAGDAGFFNIMLDDTYVVHGIPELRRFLDLARGDTMATSFSIPISDGETSYLSNRIIKSASGLRYIHKVHEVIQTKDNLNVQIPQGTSYIEDVRLEYMTQRTLERKKTDIAQLKSMLTEEPESASRTLYYIAQSYVYLKDWSTALDWFKRRVAHGGGYKGEIQDSLYHIAVLKSLCLNYPWKDCEADFFHCYDYDPSRADVLYFIGKHYASEHPSIANVYWKQGFELGMPEIQMSVRESVYKLHLPMDLACVCYTYKNYRLGLECAKRTLAYHPTNVTAKHWLGIYTNLIGATIPSYPRQLRPRERFQMKEFGSSTTKPKGDSSDESQKLLCIISEGGWAPWSGKTLQERGLGGSETFSIRYGEYLVSLGWCCIVWCQTETSTVHCNVHYRPIQGFSEYAASYRIDLILLNRSLELLPLCYIYETPVYFVYHDVATDGEVLIRHPNLKRIFGLSPWHVRQIQKIHRTSLEAVDIREISYCICKQSFLDLPKVTPYTFIYPNFPNRGLLVLLRDLWPVILEKYPGSRLNIFCDLQNSWCQTHYKKDMDEIETFLYKHKPSVTNHGWVNREVLDRYWRSAHVWLYPCTFAETCCLTAWEAAASRTLAVSNRLAALETSVGERGITLEGDATDVGWQQQILEKLFDCLDRKEEERYLDANQQWSQQKTPEIVVERFHREYLSMF